MRKKAILENEQKIRKYFKRKYNWNMSESDYQETSQSLYYLGKAIYRFLQMKSEKNNDLQ